MVISRNRPRVCFSPTDRDTIDARESPHLSPMRPGFIISGRQRGDAIEGSYRASIEPVITRDAPSFSYMFLARYITVRGFVGEVRIREL